jgi:hypothetical protein
MVLVLTLCQLSAINCVACKRSTLAMTSLAVGDDVSKFIFYDSYVHWLYQGCGVERYKFQIGHFSKNLKWWYAT